MPLLLILALCLSTPHSSVLLKDTTSYAHQWQQICLKLLPQKGQNLELQASLNCGAKNRGIFESKNLLETSLMHFFWISGSLLFLIDRFLSRFLASAFLRFPLLFFATLGTGWSPPLVRFLSSWSLRRCTLHWKIFLPADLLVLCGGLFLLILFPAWWKSESLLMGWCGALAFCMPQILRLQKKSARWICAQIFLLLFLFGPLQGIASPHPLGMVFQLFFAPIILLVLWPLSMLTMALPSAVVIFDFVFSFFEKILSGFVESAWPAPSASPWSLNQQWAWLAFLHVTLHFLRLYLWQGQDQMQEDHQA